MQQRPVYALVRDLQSYCDAEKISVSELARKAKVPQPTVHRILHAPRSNRVTPHLETLCVYANIPVYVTDKPDPTQSGVMMAALREVWDGSDAGARAIAKMLLAARDACLSPCK